MIGRPFQLLPAQTVPRVWLGVNFWSRRGGPLMWRSFDASIVRAELAILRDHGLNVTRSFFLWPDFMPAPDMIDEVLVDRYRQFLDLSHEVGLATIPTFIVGHMSGQNWDVPWRGGRDLYSDGWLLAQQAFFLREIAHRFKDHPAIAGWIVSNEMPHYGGATTPEAARSWAQLMVQAIHAAGARQPVALGDGVWGIDITGYDNGFRLRELAPAVDFFGPHVYPMANDRTRQHLTAAFTCELSQVGRPVILEEFGMTTAFTAEEHVADYYRQVLHTTLLAGAAGWLAWNNTDFDLRHQDPYRHHPFELCFGVTRSDGSPKQPLLELARFRKVLEAIDLPHCRRSPTATALLVPSYFDTIYPFTPKEERAALREILLQAYVVTREADLSPALVREVDGVPAAARLILVPSTKQLTSPTWEALEAAARQGAIVYVSYFSGVSGGTLWHPFVNEFFGIAHQFRYGVVHMVEDPTVVWTFQVDFGGLRAGDQLRFKVAGNEHGRTFLPLKPTDARVVAVDGHGRPALVERRLGRGAIVFSTYPIEYFAAMRPNANPDDTYRLYGALAHAAGACPPVTVDRPDVLVDTLVHMDGTEFVWLISQTDEPVAVTPRIAGDRELIPLFGPDTMPAAIALPPFGVRIYRTLTPVAPPIGRSSVGMLDR